MPAPPSIIRIPRHNLHWPGIRQAANAIRRGEAVVIPTDTLYGLAADPFQPKAVRRLFQIKRRPETKPILLLIDNLNQLRRLAATPLPKAFGALIEKFWPGPLTLILRAAPGLAREITAGTGTVAVRLPADPLARALIRAAGRPLTGTSANLSGRPPASTAREAQLQLGRRVHYIVDGGPAPCRLPSTIVDLTAHPRIVRSGALPSERLAAYLR